MTGYVPPRILVVDDSRMVRASIIKHLRGHYEIREEADGEAAWQSLVLDLSIVAVISDIQMPKLDGREATRQIRCLPGGSSVPIMAMTADAFDEDRQLCMEAGMDDFMTKPLDPDELYTKLLHWLSAPPKP